MGGVPRGVPVIQHFWLGRRGHVRLASHFVYHFGLWTPVEDSWDKGVLRCKLQLWRKTSCVLTTAIKLGRQHPTTCLHMYKEKNASVCTSLQFASVPVLHGYKATSQMLMWIIYMRWLIFSHFPLSVGLRMEELGGFLARHYCWDETDRCTWPIF